MNFKFQILNFKFTITPTTLILVCIIFLATFLRYYRLNTNPPGLYWDEAVFGYDAYSILKTAHDHNGNFLPLFFESFGDWKMPLYHYLLVPSIAILGLTEFAVRFPAALLGTATIFVMFLLVMRLSKNTTLALLAAFFLAISPWHIQFSRGGFESTVGLFFMLAGTYLLILAAEAKRSLTAAISGIFFVFSMYSYHAYRVIIPLFAVALVLIYRKELQKMTARLLIPLVIALLLLVPLIRFSLRDEGKSRAISQTAFKKEEFEKARLDFNQKSKKPFRFMSSYLYKEPLYYAYISLRGYAAHFSPSFLATKGDQIGRHSQVDMGQIYIFEILLILIAAFTLKMTNTNKIFLLWLILSPIPATIVTPTPHAYRTLQMAIPLAYLSGLGAYQLIFQKSLFSRLIPKVLLVSFAVYWFVSYLHLLFAHYPIKFAADWQDGYRQMVEKIKNYEDRYDFVYVTNINSLPYIYLLFYQKYNPQRFIQLAGDEDGFDKYTFVSRDADIYSMCPSRCLYVSPQWEKVDGVWLDAVSDSTNRHIYSLWEIGGPK